MNNNPNTSGPSFWQRLSYFLVDHKALWKRIFLWLVGVFGLLVIAGAALFFFYASSAPTITKSDLQSQTGTTIYDANGKVVSRLGAQKRQYASSSELPKSLKNAVVAVEDKNFYHEKLGISPTRIVKAAFSNVFHGTSDGIQGGSTITQQLIKLSVFSTAKSDQTFKRKAQEAWLAYNITKKFSKDQILTYYLNKVYMGNGVYGMKTAAQYYYGKDLDELSLAQTAILAGIPQSPSVYNPLANTTYAKERRDVVLDAMQKNGYITASQAAAAKKESVTEGLDSSHGDVESSSSQVDEPVVDAYIKQVIEELEEKGYNPTTDSLKVHTSLDTDAQQELYDDANDNVSFPSDNVQVGVAVVDPHNGQVIAMLGGRKLDSDTVYGYNRAVQQTRSSGSTAKPLMDYGPAIEYLHWPTFHVLSDSAMTWPDATGTIKDFDNKYQGNITMRQALVQSRNVPAIRALQAVGISKATKFLKGLGISQKKAYTYSSGIALYISPLQEAAAYAAFANGGTYYEPYYVTSVTTQEGTTTNFKKQGSRAMTKGTAFMITNMLEGVFTGSGIGTAAYLSGVNQAGKTGTTNASDNNNNSGILDSWMTGYTKNYSISVWTGYDDNKNTLTDSGAYSAQYLYKALMSYLDGENHASNWTMPSSLESVSVQGVTQYMFKAYPFSVEYASGSSTSSTSSSPSSSSSSSASSESSSSASSSMLSESVQTINQSSQSTTTTDNTNNGAVASNAQQQSSRR